MVLFVEECTFLVEYVFQCGGEYTQDVQQRFQTVSRDQDANRNAAQQLIQKF